MASVPYRNSRRPRDRLPDQANLGGDMVHGGEPFSDSGQIIIDSIRLTYVVGATALFVLLGWRAGRWVHRHREPAWLHLMSMFLVGSAAHTGFVNLGEDLLPTFPLNTLGVFCGVMFVWRTPPESLDRWREERGNPPDWDSVFDRIDRKRSSGSN